MSAARWVAAEYLIAKPKMRILILGSYETSAATTLNEIKDFLIAKGYGQTRLIADFTNPVRGTIEPEADYNKRKSEYWLPKADVAIFIFLENVNNDGVEYEFKHVDAHHSDMMWRSIICWSTNPRPNVSSLIEGLFNTWNDTANVVFFGKINKLCEEVFGTITGNLLKKMYYRVFNRENGEWELYSQP